MKSALLTYIGLVEVDKALVQSPADVLGKNRLDNFFFTPSSVSNILRDSRS